MILPGCLQQALWGCAHLKLEKMARRRKHAAERPAFLGGAKNDIQASHGGARLIA
jgi:hypothetical protein